MELAGMQVALFIAVLAGLRPGLVLAEETERIVQVDSSEHGGRTHMDNGVGHKTGSNLDNNAQVQMNGFLKFKLHFYKLNLIR